MLRAAACRQLHKLESPKIWPVTCGLVSLSYSPSAHTLEEIDLNFQLPQLGLPTLISYFFVRLPVITALFSIYWGKEERWVGGGGASERAAVFEPVLSVSWEPVGARWCTQLPRRDACWFSSISLAMAAKRSMFTPASSLGKSIEVINCFLGTEQATKLLRIIWQNRWASGQAHCPAQLSVPSALRVAAYSSPCWWEANT